MMKPIPLSKNQLKYLRSLQLKKYRLRHNAYIAEGNKLLQELLQRSTSIQRIFVTQDWKDTTKLTLPEDKIQIISPQDYKQVSQLSTPPAVLAVIDIPQNELSNDILYKNHCFVLDKVRDPGNLGTLLRIADWFGMPYLICSKDCVDCYNAKTVQASMGSIGSIPVFYEDLPDFFTKHPELPIFAALLNGANTAEVNFQENGLILLGNESNGISPDLLSHPHHPITILGSGQVESLNVAIAGGIIAAQTFQHRQKLHI